MVYTREDLRAQLQRREIAPVYVLFGPETYLRDLAAGTIADLSFSPGDLRDFNETTFSLNTDGNLELALAAAEQLPMMASRRVLSLKDVRISATGYRDTVTEKHEAILSAYLDDPPAHSVLIFIADELNGVRKMGRLLREKAVAVEFSRLTDLQLADWASKEFKSAGVELDDVTLRFFLARMGSDVARLRNEIRKLAAAAMPANVVTVELVDALVPNSRELTNFELTEHLVAGRGSKAMSVLARILDDGAEPLALLGLLSYNYRRLLMAKDLMERGAERREIANILKLRYSDQEPFLAAARRADFNNLRRAIERLARTDVAVKRSIGGGGPAGARMQIEVLISELAVM